MQVLKSVTEAQHFFSSLSDSSSLALVPTMGCLHRGHLALVQKAQELAQKVVVSLFVNPLQFGPGEDFEKYPRVLEKDLALLKERGVDCVFHPEASDLYPQSFSSTIEVGDIGRRLCGQFRPGHFNGVATICVKLFNITQARFAIFGEKDFQQLQVIQQTVKDLNLPIQIVSHPTVREPSGLALSSRNRYLSEEEVNAALSIPLTQKKLDEHLTQHPDCSVRELTQVALDSLRPLKVQYAEITTGQGLHIAKPSDLICSLENPRFFVAAFSGTTRLIDNFVLAGNSK